MDTCLQVCGSHFHHYFKCDEVNAAELFKRDSDFLTDLYVCSYGVFKHEMWTGNFLGLDVLVCENWKCSRILNIPHQKHSVFWHFHLFNMNVGHSQQRSQRKVVNRNVATVGLLWQLQQLDCPPSPPPLPQLLLQLQGQALTQTTATREEVVGALATTLHHLQQLHTLSLAISPLQLL